MRIFDKISGKSLPRITQTLIVCGDCAGDEKMPRKTQLTSDGLCAECGGRNYELASVLGAKLAQHLLKEKQHEQLKDSQTAGSFEPPAKHFQIVGRRS